MPIIESKFTLFEMQEEQILSDAPPLCKPRLGGSPEALDAVDVDAPSLDCENIVAMIDPMVFAVAKVNEAVVASPSIGVNDAAEVHPPSDNALQCSFFGIRDNFGVHAPVALEDAKDDGFTSRAASPFTLDALWPKVRFIHFNDTTEPRFVRALYRNPFADCHEVPVDCVAIESGEVGHFRCLKVEGKEPDNMPELAL